MSFGDLDLEFEDEEELKIKKNDAVHVGVDLEFHSPVGAQAQPRPLLNATTGISKPANNIRKIEEARPVAQQVKRTAPGVSSNPQVSVRSSGTSALKENLHSDFDSEQVIELREKMRKVEFDAEVRVQVAEFKTEIMSELLGDMKLLEHQIGQLLARINTKHPDVKNEALMIKKILADFTTKKRK